MKTIECLSRSKSINGIQPCISLSFNDYGYLMDSTASLTVQLPSDRVHEHHPLVCGRGGGAHPDLHAAQGNQDILQSDV